MNATRRLVTHVVGARPNFPKAAPVIRALRSRDVAQRLVHTGQHYDDNMSTVFFEELGLPSADVNLGVGSGSHAKQTAAIMERIEGELISSRPRLVVLYGDINSTVAAALVAAKLEIPVAHVEAGLRSFDLSMPEEVNRIVTDRLSTLLFATSPEALGNLAREGTRPDHVHFVGNPMIDTLLEHQSVIEPAVARAGLGLPECFAVATMHRPSNVDSVDVLRPLVSSFHAVADQIDVLMPVHPRGAARMRAAGLFDHPRIHGVEPVPYVRFLGLVRGAALVITDSGGIQEETTMMGVPCLTMRPNTERPVTIVHGTNRLTTPEELPALVSRILSSPPEVGPPRAGPPLWDGLSGERIAAVIEHFLAGRTGYLHLG